MVLPLVALGLLGAGYAGKNVMGDFFDERREKRQGARFDEAMAGAAPGMENRALASAGLLDPTSGPRCSNARPRELSTVARHGIGWRSARRA